MSGEHLELVRSICMAWEKGDYTSAGWAHPEMEYVIADGPAPGSWTGPTDMEERWGSFLSVWDEWQTEIEEYRELDDERVLVLGRFSGRGKSSGLDVEQMRTSGASLFYVRNGKVTRLVTYFDRERALRDLGLSE